MVVAGLGYAYGGNYSSEGIDDGWPPPCGLPVSLLVEVSRFGRGVLALADGVLAGAVHVLPIRTCIERNRCIWKAHLPIRAAPSVGRIALKGLQFHVGWKITVYPAGTAILHTF